MRIMRRLACEHDMLERDFTIEHDERAISEAMVLCIGVLIHSYQFRNLELLSSDIQNQVKEISAQ